MMKASASNLTTFLIFEVFDTSAETCQLQLYRGYSREGFRLVELKHKLLKQYRLLFQNSNDHHQEIAETDAID